MNEGKKTMKINEIMESTVSDMDQRDRAIQITRQLLAKISYNVQSLQSVRTKQGHTVYITDTQQLGIDEIFVKFFIHDKDKYNDDGSQVMAGVSQSNDVHIFYELSKNPPMDDNQRLYNTIVHELIHIFDNIRSDFKIPSSVNNMNQTGYKGYVNSDSELNAHYQEMITILEEFVDEYFHHKNYPKIYDMFLSTPEKFIDFTLSRMDKGYIDNLTEKNLKKFKRRIYQYYDTIKDAIVPQVG